MDHALLPRSALLLAHLCLQDRLYQSMQRERPRVRLTLDQRKGAQRGNRLVQLVPIGHESRTNRRYIGRYIGDKEFLRNALRVEQSAEAEQISCKGMVLLDVRVGQRERGGDTVGMIAPGRSSAIQQLGTLMCIVV